MASLVRSVGEKGGLKLLLFFCLCLKCFSLPRIIVIWTLSGGKDSVLCTRLPGPPGPCHSSPGGQPGHHLPARQVLFEGRMS